jgi:hypothetical protein
MRETLHDTKGDRWAEYCGSARHGAFSEGTLTESDHQAILEGQGMVCGTHGPTVPARCLGVEGMGFRCFNVRLKRVCNKGRV